jgi:hypothetical protein
MGFIFESLMKGKVILVIASSSVLGKIDQELVKLWRSVSPWQGRRRVCENGVEVARWRGGEVTRWRGGEVWGAVGVVKKWQEARDQREYRSSIVSSLIASPKVI